MAPESGRVKIRERRRGARRSILTSRLTRNIFMANLIGLLILVGGVSDEPIPRRPDQG